MRTLLARLPWVGRLLQALGVNAVPAAGYFGEEWSIGTTLALYWIETVLVIVLVTVRIVLHRRWTRKAGHWNADIETRTTRNGRTSVRRGKTTFLAGFLTVMGVFTAAHGVFLAVLVFLIMPQEAPMESAALADVRTGARAMALFLGLGFVLDLIVLRDRSFRWIERMSELAQGRMLITHLTIIFGMGAMAYWQAPAALLAVFFGFKTLMDLGTLFPDRAPGVEPPRWLTWLDRFGANKGGQTFSEHYRQSVEQDLRKREANEQLSQPAS